MDYSPPSEQLLAPLNKCRICPRACGVDRRHSQLGYCRNDDRLNVSSVCIHKGEEPVLTGDHGICNVFFSHCNLQCSFCQNHQISNNADAIPGLLQTVEEVVRQVEACLQQGVNCVGFVSPSHMIPQMKMIIETLRDRGLNPVFVMNTNAYDTVEQVRSLETYIDVYLPDFKYTDPQLARHYSDVENYPDIARMALLEMYRQKGATLELDENGVVRKGMIIRHLVLPGHVPNSIHALRFIARELSPLVHVSLMSQYTPTPAVAQDKNLGRGVTEKEYAQVLDELERLEMEQGWVQSLESVHHYQPDFTQAKPFGD